MIVAFLILVTTTCVGSEALSRDLKIENFDVSISGQPLLSGATLGIAYGRRYGLVGRNGNVTSS